MPDIPAFEAREREPLAHVNLRGDPADAAFLARVREVTGVNLPLAPNTTAARDDVVACWLGPDEWLVMAPAAERRRLEAALQAALAGLHASATEVSGGQVVMVLRGGAVREVLASECPLDLHPRMLGRGQCAQTRVAKAGVLLRPLEGGAIEVVVRRSFADYFRRWLDEASADHRQQPPTPAETR